ncbi:hypothetical protein GCM10023320_62710 [Pseudonocardia adelaidensis]|uniref:PH (Pleckstrin Homology) domain-containing protein n=2 Tax=Pseudonocardia adelaidensis TaxID=648754 RepID=A0ABP9NVG2_9PSEU
MLAGLGTWFVQPDSPPTFGPIECDGELMGPGDKCVVIGGAGTDFTYESEQASRQARLAAWRDEPGDEVIGWSLIGFGVLGGVAGCGAGARRREPHLRDDLTQVPPELRAAATEHRLGDHSQTHRTKPSELWAAVGGTVFFVAVTFALAVGPATSGGWVGLLVLFTGFGALSCLAATVRQLFVARTELYLFANGLVYAKGGTVTAFPWRDTEIRRSVVKQRNSSTPDYRYWLQRPGSPSVELSPTLGLNDFGPEMERRLTTDRAPADLDAVAAGQRIQYGPLALDLTGLTTPKDTIPWSQIRAIKIENGQVQVWQTDARRAQNFDVAKVPNIFVFLTLVETLREAMRRT